MLVHPETANRFLAFVNASPTPFHAVANAAVILEDAGFRKVSSRHLMGPHLPRLLQIREKDEWEKSLSPGGKYYFTRYPRPLRLAPISHHFRNQSSLLAFTIPPRWVPGTGLSIVATHVDSPNLKVIDHPSVAVA
jgi:aspartyl aminopeptidase